MIEKNIFRPLPVLKKSGHPGELGMEEEVFKFFKYLKRKLLLTQLGLTCSQFTSFSFN